MTKTDLDLFERAFSSGDNGCRRTCACGRVFYDIENHWDWEDGEMEALQANKDATAMPHACGGVILHGAEYAMDCTCWHPMAEQLIGIIRTNKRRIAKFINLEAEHLKRLAETAPKVDEA